jgi:hypothetical protein
MEAAAAGMEAVAAGMVAVVAGMAAGASVLAPLLLAVCWGLELLVR